MTTHSVNQSKNSKDRTLDHVLSYFKKAIIIGDLKPGDRMLSERKLAIKLNVSRSSIREALRVLEILGFIEILPGSGAFVLYPKSNSLSDFIELTSMLRTTFPNNILEVRFIIECEAVRLAAKRSTSHEQEIIKKALKKMLDVKVGDKSGPKADFDFP